MTFDTLNVQIADYVHDTSIEKQTAYETATLCLLDSLGCALGSLSDPECCALLGPLTSAQPSGCPIPGTSYRLDPIQAAFNIGTMIRWHDYNDTWLAAEWAHPSDNLGALLTLGHSLSLSSKELLSALIKAYEIQGVLALSNNLHQIGLDHVLFVTVATAAVATYLLGGSKEQTLHALSNAWTGLCPLRTYRHAPATTTRKAWAAGAATSQGLWLAYLSCRGAKGSPEALSAPRWGLQDALFERTPLTLTRSLESCTVENILFKVAFPAEFHAQTAAEAALQLFPSTNWEAIKEIQIETQQAACTIIDKTGPLHTPADRDHCLQYIIAICLLYGALTTAHYQEEIAQDPRIDLLRKKMHIRENPAFTRDYHDPDKRAIPNRITLLLDTGETKQAKVDYPLGHPKRRTEARPLLFKKFHNQVKGKLTEQQAKKLFSALTTDTQTRVDQWMEDLSC